MANSSRFYKLLEPAYIGKVRTKARLIRCGAHIGWGDSDNGHFSDQHMGFYEALARGGAGLIALPSPNIDYPVGLPPDLAYRLDDDKYIESFKKVTGLIHKYDCPAFIQLFHVGPMFSSRVYGIYGIQPKAASSLLQNESPRPDLDIARELTAAEVEEMVEKFVSAALRAQKAGFLGIELNAGHTHLLNSFLSRAWNRRHDAYGVDSLESRAKIMVDIIKEIKKRAGQDFTIIALINVAEYGIDNGITIAESQGLAKLLEAAGADAIHPRAEYYSRYKESAESDSTHFPDLVFYPEPPKPLGEKIDAGRHGEGGWVPAAAAIKEAVSIPVIAVGRISPELGEQILRRGMVDFVNMHRQLIADPELPDKLSEGRLEDIRPCTACLTCFDASAHSANPKCQTNASLGKEREYEIRPAAQKKKVMVVGGGPAGMEAARVAACRGHKVILYEKTNRLGGAMNLAGIVKGFEREDLESMSNYLKTQITKLGVEIKLDKEVTRSVIEEVKPDILVVATGGSHDIPKVPGIESRIVLTSENLHQRLKKYLRTFNPRTLRRFSKVWLPMGKKVVILGGNIQGCEVAEFLAKRGRKVTVLETGKEIGEGLLETLIKPRLLNWLAEKGVPMMTGVKYQEITDKGLTIITNEGKKQAIEADTIITTLPLLPNNKLTKSLDGLVNEVYSIGDCNKPALIVDAIADGSRIGHAV